MSARTARLIRNKPALVIYARGGSYPQDSPFDLQKKYLELLLRFIGFEKIESILVEPTLASPAEAEQAIQQAVERARKAGETF